MSLREIFRRRRADLIRLGLLAACLAVFFLVLYHVEYSDFPLIKFLWPMRVLVVAILVLFTSVIYHTGYELLWAPLLVLFCAMLLIAPRYDRNFRSADSSVHQSLFGWPAVCIALDSRRGAGQRGFFDEDHDVRVDWRAAGVDLAVGCAATGLVILPKRLLRRRRRSGPSGR